MTEEIILDRLFKYFNKIPTDDIDLDEWVTGFSVLLKGIGKHMYVLQKEIYSYINKTKQRTLNQLEVQPLLACF